MDSKIIFKILQYSNSIRIPVSNLRLQKILFLIQLSAYRFSLLYLYDEAFEAWRHGPVLRECYNYFKKYGRDSIPTTDKVFQEKGWDLNNPILEGLIERVIFTVRNKTDWDLVKITQNFDSWKLFYIPKKNFYMHQEIIYLDSQKFKIWEI